MWILVWQPFSKLINCPQTPTHRMIGKQAIGKTASGLSGVRPESPQRNEPQTSCQDYNENILATYP